MESRSYSSLTPVTTSYVISRLNKTGTGLFGLSTVLPGSTRCWLQLKHQAAVLLFALGGAPVRTAIPGHEVRDIDKRQALARPSVPAKGSHFKHGLEVGTFKHGGLKVLRRI